MLSHKNNCDIAREQNMPVDNRQTKKKNASTGNLTQDYRKRKALAGWFIFWPRT